MSPVWPPPVEGKRRVSRRPFFPSSRRSRRDRRTFAALRADNVDALLQRFRHVLRVTDHVHDGDFGRVHLVDDVLGRNTDGAYEQGCLALDDHVYELIKLSLGVVVVGLASATANCEHSVSEERDVISCSS